MKRSLIPKSRGDRISAVWALISVIVTLLAFNSGQTWVALIYIANVLAALFNAYVLQDRIIANPSVDEYSRVINNIEAIEKQLSELNGFLQKERTRVADTEATIRKLNEEKSKLEPLVNTQRETVDAILATHSERTAKRAWKERMIGFSLGLAASLIASMIYEYLKR